MLRRTCCGAAVLLAALAGCSGGSPAVDLPSVPSTPTIPNASGSAPTALPGPAVPVPRVVGTVASRLDVPWGVAFVAGGSALVAERPTGRVLLVTPSGAITAAGTVPGVRADGEGGLLGLAVSGSTVYAYLCSTSGDNRVVRMLWDGTHLGTAVPVLTGIPTGNHHDGGALLIANGKLWIGTGETGETGLAQDRSSLGGKILRVNLDGSVPADNPFGTPVWSYGHRNVQGLAFDGSGQLWATEFGQNTWDELNLIVKGGNYGWPDAEGRSSGGRFRNPAAQWHTNVNSPSGLAIVGMVAYIGGLRGERLWQVPLGADGTAGTPTAFFVGEYGRLRNVVAAPGGGLWVTTSNRDGRGNPTADDDRVLRVALTDPE